MKIISFNSRVLASLVVIVLSPVRCRVNCNGNASACVSKEMCLPSRCLAMGA
jgi:hypothetical protein